MDLFLLSAFLLSAIWVWFNFLRRPTAGKLPPGPYPLPLVGNLLQLGRFPHRSLANLAQTYGPLVSLHFGSVYTVVVSSSAAAKQVFQKHDYAFSSRTVTEACTVHDHNNFSMGLLSVGPQWRKLRKICQEQLFSVSRLEANQSLRREKLHKLRDYVQKCCDEGRTVNIGEAAYITTLNLMSATVFSKELTTFDSSTAGEFMDTFHGFISSLGAPNLADFFPVLKRFDPQGIRKKAHLHVGKLLQLTEDIIKQRLESRESTNYHTKSDLLDALLDLGEEGENGLSIAQIAHLVLDLFVAGSDTTAGTTEWAMTDLLLNPEKVVKLQREFDTVIGPDKEVQESDISRLPYLQAVVKEVLRRYPAGPLLLPHKTVEHVEMDGLFIPKGTQVLVNVWAIARDPERWANPDSFEPERFLDSKVDFKGQDFELLPFGSGRRMCPGMPLANRMVYMAVATFVRNFDWKIVSNLKPGEMENAEKFALSLRKAVPLKATPSARNKRTTFVA